MPIAVTTGSGPRDTAPAGSSGIRVIIIGCGYGGIAAAIECHRKGHKVIVFEKNAEIGGLGTPATQLSHCHGWVSDLLMGDITNAIGDTLGISQNGALPIYRWDNGKV